MFEAIDPILVLIILTLVPALELRASIPYGILATSISWPLVFLICVATNRYVEDKIKNDIKKKNITDDKVKVTSVFGFDVG